MSQNPVRRYHVALRNSRPTGHPMVHSIHDLAAATFATDGVALVCGAVGRTWVERLRAVADNPDVNGVPFMFMRNMTCRRAVRRSGLGAVAARVLGTPRATLLYDEFLVKSPGRSLRTPPHQDLSYWPLDGADICTVWLALDPVDSGNGGVVYARGSHRGPFRYRRAFLQSSKLNVASEADGLQPPAELESSGFDVVSFELRPGDAVVHHASTLHGAAANNDLSRPRRAYITRWFGPGTRYRPGEGRIELPYAGGLTVGAALERCRLPTVGRLKITSL